ncbi:MAG: hypothetical protein ACK58T_10310 [Phycisphaerae bacterium]
MIGTLCSSIYLTRIEVKSVEHKCDHPISGLCRTAYSKNGCLKVVAINVSICIEAKSFRNLMERLNFDRILRFGHGSGLVSMPLEQRIQAEHLNFDSVMRFSHGSSHASTPIAPRFQTELLDFDSLLRLSLPE